MFESGFLGWLSLNPDLALRAILLFFDILKLDSAAKLSTVGSGVETLFASLFPPPFSILIPSHAGAYGSVLGIGWLLFLAIRPGNDSGLWVGVAGTLEWI